MAVNGKLSALISTHPSDQINGSALVNRTDELQDNPNRTEIQMGVKSKLLLSEWA
jgi:hypothetical protein